LILKEVEKPMFAYYHSLIPHVPYYFQGNGSLKSLNSALSVGSYQDYIQQIEYSNLLTLKQIDRILKYKPNSIIMIMSDHGFKNLQGVSQEVKSVEALKNFSALYCPNNAKVRLDSLLTPISLMKIVLDQALLKKSSE
jgi:phosphoglycerol transferase MdoB-like AlkP superfamily enzyme